MFCDAQDNLSAKEREALKKHSASAKVKTKKADKGNTTVVMDTQRKIAEGKDQVYDSHKLLHPSTRTNNSING